MLRNSGRNGCRSSQKQVRGVAIQLCGFLQKLGSLTFYCEPEKKLQDKMLQLVKIN